jgi:predicted anti-sigma-YlaC factor YlaD
MMLSCKEATRLISQRQDRALSLGERVLLGLHLAICDGCRAVSRQVDFLRRALRQLFSGQ